MTMHIATRRALLQSAAAGGGWWDIDGQTVVAAHNAIGAADLADSYINLANPGTNDAAPGVAPTWVAGTGWTFNGSTQYLTTGILPAEGMTILVRFTGLQNFDAPFGSYSTSTGWLYLFNNTDTNILAYRYGNSVQNVAPSLSSGVVGIAGGQPYRDGISEGADMAWFGTNENVLTIGAINKIAGPSNFMSGAVQAIAIYSTTLNAGDVSTLTTAMNALS